MKQNIKITGLLTFFKIMAVPHNGAMRFGERFWHKRKYEKRVNTGCISHAIMKKTT